MGKNGYKHNSRNFDIFAIKMTYLNALLSFLLSSRFSATFSEQLLISKSQIRENFFYLRLTGMETEI